MFIGRGAIVGALLIGPTALAFFSGGYFDRARLIGAIVAWLAAAGAAVFCGRCWPRTRVVWLVLGGLAAFTAWTIVSIAWSPLRDEGQADAQRALLYLGILIAGASVFRDRRLARAVEPVLALGTVIVIGEGLSERVLPGVFHLARDPIASGRLEQPITYWNALGLLAAIGLVLITRVAGDASRPRWLRVAAYAIGPVSALAVYLTVSRGAILAAGIGLVILLVLDANRAQLRGIVQVLASSVPAIVLAVLRSDLRSLGGALGVRERDGLLLLGMLALSAVISSVLAARAIKPRLTDPVETGRDRVPQADPVLRRVALAGLLVGAFATMLVVVITATSQVSASSQPSASNARLASTETVRGNFWRAAVHGFLDHPIAGTGAGGFEAEWDQQRTIIYSAKNAHSMYLETLSNLGLIGGLILLWFVAAAIGCARRAYRIDPISSTGAIAGMTMWAIHAGFDWDWQMTAVTAVAAVLLSSILAHADTSPGLPESAFRQTPSSDRAASTVLAG